MRHEKSIFCEMLTTSSPELFHKIDAYWRAANYLSVGQIFLFDNPLLKRPLAPTDVKRMLLGHGGTTPGQNFIYAHLNRVMKALDLDMIYVSGPGHGGPAVVANTYLEGTSSEVYPDISQDEAGLQKLFLQFSFPGGILSHASPETLGSMPEGGELGYSLSHSFGAVFDNPELIVACVVGDGEAETGPLATAWHSNKFLDPVADGAVLPILPLNGYKIANLGGSEGFSDHNILGYLSAGKTFHYFDSDEKRPLNISLTWVNCPANRNTYHNEFTAALQAQGPFASRSHDALGIGFIAAYLSDDYSASVLTSRGRSAREECIIEVAYKIATTRWLTLQPDF
jgi:phosphoketolase